MLDVGAEKKNLMLEWARKELLCLEHVYKKLSVKEVLQSLCKKTTKKESILIFFWVVQ